MKKSWFGLDLTIDTKKTFTHEELYALLSGKLPEKFPPLELRKNPATGDLALVAPSGGNCEFYISPRKNKISVVQTAIITNLLGTHALHNATDGVNSFLKLTGAKDNQGMMIELAEEIEKIVQADALK